MKEKLKSRDFQLWYYRVSHGELLIRSPKDKENITNIDIMFFDVKYIELPRHLPNLTLEEAKYEDKIYLKEKTGHNYLKKDIVVINSNGNRHIIVATIYKIIENELDLFDLPFEKLGH